MKSGSVTTLGGCVVLFSILVGILNFSSDESYLYRFLFETIIKVNNKNFQYGCVCFYNKLDKNRIYAGDESFCSLNGCTSEITIASNKFYKSVVLGFDLGLGDSFVDGEWEVNEDLYDLGDVLTEFTMGVTNTSDTFIDKLNVYAEKIYKYLIVEQWRQWYERKYTVTKSITEDVNTISSHYDFGNDLYGSFQDDTRMYSCAIWGYKNCNFTLTQAQEYKVDLLMNKMNINENDNVLDIGSGWGFTAYNIQSKTNANVTGITISKEQVRYQKEKYNGLITQPNSDKLGNNKANYLNYRLLDYRDVDEINEYNINKIISIGMYEHVHLKNAPIYFESAAKIQESAMKKDALNGINREYIFGLHYITKHGVSSNKFPIDKNTECDNHAFHWKYIFPGGCIIHADWTYEIARNYGYMLLHQEHFGIHYSKTLRIWRNNWRLNYNKLVKKHKQYNQEKIFRIYDYYLAFSEAMFRTGHIGLVQQVFIKPNKYLKNKNKFKDNKHIYTKFEDIEPHIYVPNRPKQ